MDSRSPRWSDKCNGLTVTGYTRAPESQGSGPTKGYRWVERRGGDAPLTIPNDVLQALK